jgi:hypothetical protein
MARPRNPVVAAAKPASYVVATDRQVWDADGPKDKGDAIKLTATEAKPLIDAGLVAHG